MWRTILLGKLSISILASLIVGGICLARPWRIELGVVEAAQWTGLGAFFVLLGLGQIGVIYILTKKKR